MPSKHIKNGQYALMTRNSYRKRKRYGNKNGARSEPHKRKRKNSQNQQQAEQQLQKYIFANIDKNNIRRKY